MTAEKTKDPTPLELVPPYPHHPFFTDGDGQQLTVGGGTHAFKHDALGFELVNAWWLAEAATLVYDNETFVAERFRHAGLPEVSLFDRVGTQCFVAANERLAVVAFRGTESGARSLKELRQIVLDVQDDEHFLLTSFAPGGRIHRGFAGAVAAVWEDAAGFRGLKSHLAGLAGSRALWFTGHSLGAAAATVAATLCEQSGMRVSGLYTYGSPRVGDADFAAHFRGLFPGTAGRDYQRFANERDIVTLVPPEPFGYRHVGAAHHIEADGTITAQAAQPDVAPNELVRVINDMLLKLLPEPLRKLLVPDLGKLGLKLPQKAEQAIDGIIASLPHDLIDHVLLSQAPEPLKHHVPTMYANRIWNAYVRTLQ
ncbi:MAG: lipase family protein [Pyrinomonadaceae bacterium]